DLVWMTEQSMVPGRPYDLKFATGASAGTISKIHNMVDINTMEKREADEVKLNEIALVEVSLDKAVPFDAYAKVHGTGCFIVIDRLTNVTIGAGMIVG
ncbi:sulfate adenylyltransferase subunit CysN, partial [Wenyingzhuangia sp. 1_MG-2023]|nr:sulfate adenylyltransferase subunit CysN [Wenyingzhuangia sp. 1_MG-2023]